jgi:glycine/D-amino acid oxidase-like deaminating enzyme
MAGSPVLVGRTARLTPAVQQEPRQTALRTLPEGENPCPLGLSSGMTDPRHGLSFWFDGAGELPAPAPQAWQDRVQVAIVGAGYTGLWTAWYLQQLDPALDIAVYETERCGFGASGRNGGWCVGLAWGLEALLARDETRSRGLALARELFRTVDEVARVCRAESIDAHYAKGGALTVATVPFRAGVMQRELERLYGYGLDERDYQWLPPDVSRTRLGIRANHGALYFSHCAALHPARLVLGLADAVRGRGVAIHEETPVQALEAGRVHTARGTVRADVVIRATEGYTGSLAGEARSILPVYSMVTATEPLPAEVWRSIGLARRETFGDWRRVVIYGQRTRDDRLVLGGRGGYYFGSARHRTVSPREPRLLRVRHLVPELFPVLKDVRITHAWGGLMGVQRHWRPGVCFDRATGIGWAGGYVGEGVAASNLAARILADLVLERRTALTELPWVGDRARRWEVEPLRWLGARLMEHAAERADALELARDRPSRLWGRIFAAAVGGA